MDACLMPAWVTDRVVVVVALAAVETVKDVALGMVLIVTVSEFVFVAVNVTPEAVAVAAIFNVKLVALLTGEAVVTVVLPLVVLAVNVLVVEVVLGIPVPVTVMPSVRVLVEPVVTVVLPLVVFAVIVEDAPVLVT